MPCRQCTSPRLTTSNTTVGPSVGAAGVNPSSKVGQFALGVVQATLSDERDDELGPPRLDARREAGRAQHSGERAQGVDDGLIVARRSRDVSGRGDRPQRVELAPRARHR